MPSSIEHTKSIIRKQVKHGKAYDVTYPFIKYSKIYTNTNENIHGCFNLIDFTSINNALVVLSSGDYLFNLIINNVYNIDTFDSNSLTEYYVFGLKMAMIQKYDYTTFNLINSKLVNSNTSLEEITSIILDLLPLMDNKYRKYWYAVANYNYKLQKKSKNPLNLFSLIAYERENVNIYSNTYTISESNYNNLKKKLLKANITFKCADAANPIEIANNKKYDLILLSNILDFFMNKWGEDWGCITFNTYIKKLYNISNEEATILLAYCLSPNSKNIIKHSNIKEEYLNGDVYKIDSFYDQGEKDLIILNKKKKYAGKDTIYTCD